MPNSTERDDFNKHLATLFGGFPRMMLTPERKDGYWKGLANMSLGTFERCVDRALGEHGEDELPGPKRIWKISQEMRALTRAVQLAPTRPSQSHDEFTKHGNEALFSYLMTNGGASYASMQRMVQAKNKLCDDYRTLCTDGPDAEPQASLELLDKLVAAFDKHFVRMSAAELAHVTDHFQRTGHVPLNADHEAGSDLRTGTHQF